MKRVVTGLIILLVLVSCRGHRSLPFLRNEGNMYAKFFELKDSAGTGLAISISPYDGSRDTLKLNHPLGNIICMSSSYIACLDAIGCDSVISGVSGLRYISSPAIRSRSGSDLNPVYDVGYEAAPDYEKILSLHPDVFLTYTVSSVEPPYLSKLRSMGVRVFVLYDHMEGHPLARAEYVRLFGFLTGREAYADSLFDSIAAGYNRLADRVADSGEKEREVLMNIPYQDQWFVPGGLNYMSILVRDAGGSILGSVPDRRESSIISLEDAYRLSEKADYWLNVGWCRSLSDLAGIKTLFGVFPVNKMKVYNNILRATNEGGNDFWESGAVRPDLILEDLVRILHPGCLEDADSLHYYIKIQ